MEKKRIAILFGGRSAEHEVSIRSARNVLAALDRDKYEPILVGIAKDGSWRSGDSSRALLESGDGSLRALAADDAEVALLPSRAADEPGSGSAVARSLSPGQGAVLMDLERRRPMDRVDVVFPVLHGTNGEDGTVQGMLKLAGIPFVGPGVLGSAACMDKDAAKRLLRDAGIPVAPWLTLRSPPPGRALEIPVREIGRDLGYPCFVKPANCGSSVGVSKVHSEEELGSAIEEAFRFDRKVLVEKGIRGRELECSVLGNREPLASLPGEVIPRDDFYSYQAKYVDENGAALEIPAKLEKSDIARVQDMAVRAFLALECEGMARVDFFLADTGELLVNELNTIPGFTSISMYPKLWEASGIGYAELIDRLISLAIERHAEEERLRMSY
jgi:D-alanine-D-alanine ligase